MTTGLRVLAVWSVVVLMACGGAEGTDRPGDCDDDQYYDEGNERCVTCPAMVAPECRPGCEVVVVEDNRDCPTLECEQDCGQ